MSDHLWMYLDSSQGLYKKDYYRGFKGFINFELSNLKNSNGGRIRCLCE
jgi:hypothetical protein